MYSTYSYIRRSGSIGLHRVAGSLCDFLAELNSKTSLPPRENKKKYHLNPLGSAADLIRNLDAALLGMTASARAASTSAARARRNAKAAGELARRYGCRVVDDVVGGGGRRSTRRVGGRRGVGRTTTTTRWRMGGRGMTSSGEESTAFSRKRGRVGLQYAWPPSQGRGGNVHIPPTSRHRRRPRRRRRCHRSRIIASSAPPPPPCGAMATMMAR